MKSRLPTTNTPTLDAPTSIGPSAGQNALASNRVSKTSVSLAPPTSTRSGGQRTIGLFLLAGLVVLGYLAWGTLFQLNTYGVVSGNVVNLSPAWAGTISEINVRPGDKVKQGTALVSLSSIEMQNEIARVGDSLLAAKAALEAESARITMVAHQRFDLSHGAWAEFHLLEGEYEAAKAKLSEIDSRLLRYTELASSQVVTAEDIYALKLEKQGQDALVDRYGKALEERRLRANAATQSEAIDALLEPHRSKIKSLTNQLARLREKQSRGTIRAPFSGKVVDVNVLVSEYCRTGEPILSLVQQGTTELVIYVSQQDALSLSFGQHASVQIEPGKQRVECRVSRVGTQYTKPAREIQERYRDSQLALPIHLEPIDDSLLVDLPLGTPLQLLRVRGGATPSTSSLPIDSLRSNAATSNGTPRPHSAGRSDM